MRFGVVTLFPAMLEVLAREGVAARAMTRGLLQVRCFNPRDHATDRHRTVDDRPYGGGPGMVMRVEPLRAATRAARAAVGGDAPTVYLTPQGERLDQALVESLAARPALVLVCGRYEGVDERFVASEVDMEVSLGDFVLSGGEIPAMAVIEAITRLLPGALGHEDSAREDSFVRGWLDCPHYTRPEEIDGARVPSVLLSGDHAAIARWRRKQSLGRTAERRPDLIDALALDGEAKALLEEYVREQGTRRCEPEGGES